MLARRVAVAAWRLARADRMEVELFEERRWEDAGVGMALIRDGNGTRSFETLLRYRSAAMAEFWRALKTLKALQAEQAADTGLDLGAPDPAGTARPSSATERTRAPRRARPGLPAGRAARVRGAATARATSAAERTRDQPRAARGGARLRHEPQAVPNSPQPGESYAAPGVPQSRTNPSRSESWEGDERHGK